MGKYKVCVYAICKNEEKFVKRWYESMSEADYIYVLDTGSTDNTVNLFRELGVNIMSCEVVPWRFDVARNMSLDMVCTDCDICVCTDLDEVFNKGWRIELEKIWDNNVSRVNYIYNWSVDSSNNPRVSFYLNNIHSRYGYKWVHPVHEVLTYCGDKEECISSNDIVLNHHPDISKSRSGYLPLLELSVVEEPNDDRNMHYLGREYMYYQRWNDCIDTLIKHLNLETATWKDERAASMRFIARSYIALNRYNEAYMWYDMAICEAPYLRDAYIEKAMLANDLKDYKIAIDCCLKALEIKTHTKSYINEIFSWNETVYDLLSISYYYVGNYKKSLEYSNIAIKLNSNDERLLNNNKLIKEMATE